MVKHMIIWKLKDEIADKKARAQEIKIALEGLVGKIEGLLEMHILTEGFACSSGDLMMDSAFTDEAALAAFAGEVEIECRAEDGHIAYYVGGEAPGERIRMPEINAHASKVATVKAVRDRITSLLRGMTESGNLVVEGRDITTAVFPDSPARFYLTASAEARSRRRRTGSRLSPERSLQGPPAHQRNV